MSRAKTLETYRRLFDEKSPPFCPNCEKPMKNLLIEVVKAIAIKWDKDCKVYYQTESIENMETIKIFCEQCGKSIKDDAVKTVLRKLVKVGNL